MGEVSIGSAKRSTLGKAPLVTALRYDITDPSLGYPRFPFPPESRSVRNRSTCACPFLSLSLFSYPPPGHARSLDHLSRFLDHFASVDALRTTFGLSLSQPFLCSVSFARFHPSRMTRADLIRRCFCLPSLAPVVVVPAYSIDPTNVDCHN